MAKSRRPPARSRAKSRTVRSRAQPSRPAPRRRTKPRPAAPPRAAGREFQRLVDVMQRLRRPDGCPWDREQTLETLRPFVLEETHEVLDAIDRGDHDALRGEIGDFLFEGVFLAQIEAESGHFTVADSLRAVVVKLIRRHPHVFARRRGIDTPGRVLQQWEQIKAAEQEAAGARTAVLGSMPKTLPALLGAHEIGARVAAVGFDWARPADVVDKIEEEVRELRHAVEHEGTARTEDEMGDLLFSIANLARKLGVEPESALRKANQKFSARFAALEAHLAAEGRSVHEASLEEMEKAWGAIKGNYTDHVLNHEEHEDHEGHQESHEGLSQIGLTPRPS